MVPGVHSVSAVVGALVPGVHRRCLLSVGFVFAGPLLGRSCAFAVGLGSLLALLACAVVVFAVGACLRLECVSLHLLIEHSVVLLLSCVGIQIQFK